MNARSYKLATHGTREKRLVRQICMMLLTSLAMFTSNESLHGQEEAQTEYVIHTSWLYDGETVRAGWILYIKDDLIVFAGPAKAFLVPEDVTQIDLTESYVIPGMIDAHTHLLLHPYDETSWNDQVLVESVAERIARAMNHAEATLVAGFTTIRDLGTEGAGYHDVGIKQSIGKGISPGPRMLVAGRAIVATGSYGPKGFADHVPIPIGAEEADGQNLTRVVRDQIGNGADLVKVYADYRWGPNGEAKATFTQAELEKVVAVAASSGRSVVAHAATAEGMRRGRCCRRFHH